MAVDPVRDKTIEDVLPGREGGVAASANFASEWI